MKKILSVLMLVLCAVVLSACGNNAKNMFEGKTYFAEPLDGDDTFLLEFQDEKYVELIYPQFGSEIGTYSISEEKYDGMYHIILNIKELGHEDYLFDEKNMKLLAVDHKTLKYDENSYDAEHYDLKIDLYDN